MKVQKSKTITYPYDENGVTSLLFLEDQLKNSWKDQNIVKKLVSIYAYYDSVRDPIKVYFMDKMQQSIIKFNQIDMTPQNNFSANDKKVSKGLPIKTLQQKQGNSKKVQLFDLRKKQMQKNMMMDNKIQNQAKDLKRSIVDNINKFEQTSQQNRSVIYNQLRSQQDNLNSKLMKRREKSINKSMEKSFDRIRNKSAMLSKESPNNNLMNKEYQKFAKKLEESVLTGSILQDLDDDDKKQSE